MGVIIKNRINNASYYKELNWKLKPSFFPLASCVFLAKTLKFHFPHLLKEGGVLESASSLIAFKEQ